MKKYAAEHRIASIDELLIKNGAIYTAERRKELPKKLYIPFSNEGNMLSYSGYDMTPE